MGSALDQEVRSMQDWLREAWESLGQSLSRSDRRELRIRMKQVEENLRIALSKRDEWFARLSGNRPSAGQDLT